MKLSAKTKYLIRTFFFFMLVTSIPLIVLSFFSLSQFKSHLLESQTQRLEQIRDDRIREIKANYEDINKQLSLFSFYIANDYLQNQAFEPTNAELELFTSPDFIDSLYIFNKDKSLIFHTDQKIDEDEIIANLQVIQFDSAYNNSNFVVTSNQDYAYQYVYYKIIHEGTFLGYAAFKLNNVLFNPLFNSLPNQDLILLNNNFQVISSSNAKFIYTTIINPVTKNVLDGLTDIQEFDGEYHAYSFIDLAGQNMYIDIVQPINEILAPINDHIIFMVVIVLACYVFAVIAFWKYAQAFTKKPSRLFGDTKQISTFQFESLIHDLEDVINTMDDLKAQQRDTSMTLLSSMVDTKKNTEKTQAKFIDLKHSLEQNTGK